eukprot:scaffold297427_cov30-Tisochrysis_lutea.AAC.1
MMPHLASANVSVNVFRNTLVGIAINHSLDANEDDCVCEEIFCGRKRSRLNVLVVDSSSFVREAHMLMVLKLVPNATVTTAATREEALKVVDDAEKMDTPVSPCPSASLPRRCRHRCCCSCMLYSPCRRSTWRSSGSA